MAQIQPKQQRAKSVSDVLNFFRDKTVSDVLNTDN